MATVSLQDDLTSTFSEAEDVVIGIYITLVGTLSILANIIVSRGILMKDEQMTDMDIITLCIALCQVAPALLSYPLVLLSAFSHGWYFSKNVCNLDGFFIYFFAMSTIGALLVMTAYRYFRMFRPHIFTRPNETKVKIGVMVGLVVSFLYGLLWALPPTLGVGSYTLEPHHLACSIKWESVPMYYVIALLAFGYLMPVSVMTVCYGRIIRTVRSSEIKTGLRKRGGLTKRKDFRVTVVCVLHSACFLLVWTPYAILSGLAMFEVALPHWLYVSTSLFAKVDTLVNPFIFFVISKLFVQSKEAGNTHVKGEQFQLVRNKMQKKKHAPYEGQGLLNPCPVSI